MFRFILALFVLSAAINESHALPRRWRSYTYTPQYRPVVVVSQVQSTPAPVTTQAVITQQPVVVTPVQQTRTSSCVNGICNMIRK